MGWIEFFESFADYRNTFERVQPQDDLVRAWRIYEDTEENRKKFALI